MKWGGAMVAVGGAAFVATAVIATPFLILKPPPKEDKTIHQRVDDSLKGNALVPNAVRTIPLNKAPEPLPPVVKVEPPATPIPAPAPPAPTIAEPEVELPAKRHYRESYNDICARHHLRKVMTHNGRGWRCR